MFTAGNRHMHRLFEHITELFYNPFQHLVPKIINDPGLGTVKKKFQKKILKFHDKFQDIKP